MWGDMGRYGGAILLSSLPSSMASKDTSPISPQYLPYTSPISLSPHISPYLLIPPCRRRWRRRIPPLYLPYTSPIPPLCLPYTSPISPHISSYLLAVVDGVEGAEQLERQRLGAEVRVRVREG